MICKHDQVALKCDLCSLEEENMDLKQAMNKIYDACKSRTFQDCGDLRKVVYDIAYEIVNKY